MDGWVSGQMDGRAGWISRQLSEQTDTVTAEALRGTVVAHLDRSSSQFLIQLGS